MKNLFSFENRPNLYLAVSVILLVAGVFFFIKSKAPVEPNAAGARTVPTDQIANGAVDSAEKHTQPDNSREVYDLASAYINRKKYDEGIQKLHEIREGMEMFTQAQKLLSETVEIYENEVLMSAAQYSAEGNHSASVSLLRSASEIIGLSPVLAVELSQAEETYFSSVVESAKTAYFNEGKDRALSIVNVGLSVMPDNPKLMRLQSLFESVVSVPAEEIKYYGSMNIYSSAEDSYGNMHYGSLLRLPTLQSIDFTPYEKYTRFTAQIFAMPMQELQSAEFKIYCDGILAYDTGEIDRQFREETISLDITGVYSLKIITDGSNPYITVDIPGVWLENPTFIKGITENDINLAIQ